MFRSLLARTNMVAKVRGIKEEQRHTPLEVDRGTSTMVLGGHPYIGYIVCVDVGPFRVKVRSFNTYEIGEEILFSKLWAKRDRLGV